MPVTALAFVRGTPRSWLLTGEGSFLRVFDTDTSELLFAQRLFHTQAIHGINVCENSNEVTVASKATFFTFLVWGGKSLCVVQLNGQAELRKGYIVQSKFLRKETLLSDRILDVCISPSTSAALPGATGLEAFILTSHNALFVLPLRHSVDSYFIRPFSKGPRSMLYSGHLIFLEPDCLLVASGTVFGKILIWSCDKTALIPSSGDAILGHLLYSFSGHDGSIFGVRLSEPYSDLADDPPRRFLASCSDDRTIKLWDISDVLSIVSRCRNVDGSDSCIQTGTEVDGSGCEPNQSRCLSTVMGHASRIWGLRFLASMNNMTRVVSNGEDATMQVWYLKHKHTPATSFSMASLNLYHEKAHRYHTGKNIWAMAVSEQEVGGCLVFTGGADGRIVSSLLGLGKSYSSSRLEWRLKNQEASSTDILPRRLTHSETGNPLKLLAVDTPAARIFTSMTGIWTLYRVLQSEIPTYPSGTFKGIAKLISRPPTDTAYDGELLYTEEGELVTKRGLLLKGSRRYVYRYQRANDEITAWFVKPDPEANVDYLFHRVEFRGTDVTPFKQDERNKAFMLEASGHHSCVDDQYEAKYGFLQKCGVLEEWSLRYDVKGPKKDYSADAQYTRRLLGKEYSTVDLRKVETETNAEVNRVLHSGTIRTEPLPDTPKSYSWISENELLATTTKGYVILGTLSSFKDISMKDVSWEEITQLSDLASYSVTTSVRNSDCVLLSGKQGSVYLYQNHKKSVSVIMTLPNKVTGLFTQELHDSLVHRANYDLRGIVVACLGSLHAYYCTIQLSRDLSADNCHMSELVSLKLPSHFVVTSAQWIGSEAFIALGSRSGALCIYEYSECTTFETSVTPFPCFRHVQGEDAITSIQNLPAHEPVRNVYFLTTSRNGTCAIHHLTERSVHASKHLRLETVHVIEPPFGPNIEGALFDKVTNDLIIWGFRSKSFVIWNDTKHKEVFEAECGGSHRSWAFRPSNDGKEGGAFVWTQASICNINTHEQASHQIAQFGGHGREIKAIASYEPDGHEGIHTRSIIATGAEDTTVRIFVFNNDDITSSHGWVCRGILKTHTTGIQQLRWTPDGGFLFSAGGCEELFAWRIRAVPYIDVGITFLSRCPPVTEGSDLRIMDFDVLLEDDKVTAMESPSVIAVAYSDSSVRVSFSAIIVSNN